MITHTNKWIWGTTQQIITHNGIATVRIEYIDNYSDTASIGGLSVLEEHRKKGYATELMKIAEDEIRKMQKKTIYLSLEKEEWLYNFYVKLGYVLYDEDEDYKYMSKELS